jgi:hypothetical protein
LIENYYSIAEEWGSLTVFKHKGSSSSQPHPLILSPHLTSSTLLDPSKVRLCNLICAATNFQRRNFLSQANILSQLHELRSNAY